LQRGRIGEVIVVLLGDGVAGAFLSAIKKGKEKKCAIPRPQKQMKAEEKSSIHPKQGERGKKE
jgi:hypothetical protein